MNTALISVLVHILIEIALIIRVMTRPHRDPASRIAWVAVIAALPIFGMLAYILLGETNVGHRRIARMKEVIRGMPSMGAVSP
jgi:cardiolipin synthase